MNGKLKTLDELNKELTRLRTSIRNILWACDYDACDDLSALEIQMDDPDGLFLWDELRGIMRTLDDVQEKIAQINAPVWLSGTLHKNERGRYALPGQEFDFTCGSRIEVLIDDDFHEVPYMASGRIEHNGVDYYFTGCKTMPLEGAYARIRRPTELE